MDVLRYTAYKVGQLLLMFWAVLTFLFFLFRSLPGSFADQLIFQGASPELVAELEAKWGLNEPLYVQYINYMTNFIQGDAGISFQYRQPVIEVVQTGFMNSIILALPPIICGYLFGVIVGSIMGTNRGSKLEKYGIIPLFVLGTVPSFFLAILVVIVISVWFGWFPTSGMSTGGSASGLDLYLTRDFLWHYTLPFTVIFLRYTFLPTVLMRTSVVDTMRQDFIFYQRVAGIPKMQRMRSIIKHSSIPLITMIPISMTRAIGGVVLVEFVFGWPGIGVELVNAVGSRDYPLVQFTFFVIAAVVITLNTVVDILYPIIDPRIETK
jgi:peptide/nickel transport system permease protein